MLVVAQWCLTVCDPMYCSPSGSSVHGILQARILEWVAIPFSKESFQPRDRTQVSHITGRFLTFWATREDYFTYMLFYLKTHNFSITMRKYPSIPNVGTLLQILHWYSSEFSKIWKARYLKNGHRWRIPSHDFFKKMQCRDLPGGPVVGSLPCNIGDVVSQETGIPCAAQQRGQHATTNEPVCHN